MAALRISATFKASLSPSPHAHAMQALALLQSLLLFYITHSIHIVLCVQGLMREWGWLGVHDSPHCTCLAPCFSVRAPLP